MNNIVITLIMLSLFGCKSSDTSSALVHCKFHPTNSNLTYVGTTSDLYDEVIGVYGYYCGQSTNDPVHFTIRGLSHDISLHHWDGEDFFIISADVQDDLTKDERQTLDKEVEVLAKTLEQYFNK